MVILFIIKIFNLMELVEGFVLNKFFLIICYFLFVCLFFSFFGFYIEREEILNKYIIFNIEIKIV